MRLIAKPFIIQDELPETVLLIPYKHETIRAIIHFSKAEKIKVLEDQFLVYSAYYHGRSFLIINSCISYELMLLIMRELQEKNVRNYYLLNKTLSLNDKYCFGDITFTKSSQLYAARTSVSLKCKGLPEKQKFLKSLTISFADLILHNKIADLRKYSSCQLISHYDYYFLSFLNKYKLYGFAINYIIGNEKKINEKEAIECFDTAIHMCLNFKK